MQLFLFLDKSEKISWDSNMDPQDRLHRAFPLGYALCKRSRAPVYLCSGFYYSCFFQQYHNVWNKIERRRNKILNQLRDVGVELFHNLILSCKNQLCNYGLIPIWYFHYLCSNLV